MQVDVYPSVSAAEQWFEPWEELAQANLFLSPSWLRPIVTDGQVAVCIASDQNQLLGVLPLVRRPKGNLALGLGDNASDYGGFLLRDENPAPLEDMIREGFRTLRTNRLRLRHLPHGSREDSIFRELVKSRQWSVEYRDRSQNFSLPLIVGDFEKTLSGLRSSKSRYNLRRSQKKLNESGEVLFRQAKNDDDVDRVLSWLGMKHAAAWPKSIYHTTEGRHQIQAQAHGLLGQNRLGLFWLEQEGVILAAQFGMMTADRFYYYNVGYDEALAQYSPGSLLLKEILQHVCQNGIQNLDLLVGPEPYKAEWGGVARTLYTYTLCNPYSLSGKALGRFWRVFRHNRILP